jgi:exonuclease SbcC
MRLLALRGANLASLAEPFDIDFTATPLNGAGIFAITGPTGAGKSTLLDAICLALYDALPRLDSAESGIVAGETAPQQRYDDVRGVLRHGAGRGFAEVEFIGQDRRRYAARWEVNRARDKPGGPLQAQRLVLRDLQTGLVIGDKKTETLAAIERLVGLSFSQFRRAVLLAQGEFDSFIRAKAKDRAELLEKITATEIYSRLSIAAFQRARTAREEIAVLSRQADQQQPLDDGARAAVMGRLEQARAALVHGQSCRAALEADARWHQEMLRLDADLTGAQQALAVAVQAETDAAPAHLAWTRANRAWALRGEFVRAEEFGRRRDASRAELATCVTAEQAAEAALQQATATHAGAVQALAEVEVSYAAAGPQFDRAKELDALLTAARNDVAVREAELSRDKGIVRDQSGMLESSLRREAALKASRAAEQEWFDRHPQAASVAARLDEVLGVLGERDAERGKADRAARDVVTIRREEAAAGLETARLEGLVSAARLKLSEAEASRGAMNQQVAGVDHASNAALLAGVQAGLVALHEAARAARDHVEATKGCEEAATAREMLRNTAEQLAAELLAVDAEAPVAQARMQEAARSLAFSRAAASDQAALLRAELVDGAPCPVCGATDHAAMAVDAVLQARLIEDRAREAELAGAVAALRDRRVAAEAGARANGTQSGEAARRLDMAVAAQARAASAWRDCAGPAGLDALSIDADAVQALLPGARRRLAVLDDEADAQGRRQKALTDLIAACDRLRREVEAQAQALTSTTTLRRDAANAVVLHDQAARAAEAACFAAAARLDAVLAPGWHELDDPAAACRTLAADYATRSLRAQAAETELDGLRGTLAGLQSGLTAANQALVAAEAAHTAALRKLAGLAADRALVLDGQAVEPVRDRFEAQRKAAIAARDAAGSTMAAAERQLAKAQGQAVAVLDTLRQLAAEAQAAEEMLVAALGEAGLERDEVRAAIAVGEAGLLAEKSRLDDLAAAISKATTVQAERRQRRERHATQAAPMLKADAVAAALAELATALDAADRERTEADAALRADDDLLARVSGWREQAAELRRKAAVWEQLNELIGSANGDRFRRHAQGLTLEHLVTLANAHLTDLAPRYALQRAGGEMMLQVVDHDMADEVRGLHNLSGGERFLVSLALALGLATMSTGQGVRVETLFIDEGFGALDGQALGQALAVLEQLQATGRQVGVISHVEALKEAIGVQVQVSRMGGGRSRVAVVMS